MTGPALAALHTPPWISEQALRTDCRRCGAIPGEDCTCGPGSKHLARYVRARDAQLISAADEAYFIPDGDVFTGATVIPDPGPAAA